MNWQGKASIDLFERIPLFAGLPRDALANLVGRMRVVRLAEREILFQKGDSGDALYVVAEGLIRIGVMAPDGRQVSYGLIRPGHLFGEIAVFDNGPRTADASAITDSVLLSLGRANIHDFLTSHPAYALRLIGVLCQRMRGADQLIEDLLFMTLPGRVAKHLLVLSDMQAGAVHTKTIRISQQDLANQMATSRESINRLFSKWEQAGVVALWRGSVTIQDREALETYMAE
ncbi:MAG: Crp/Fnr family transcriptional regulator [Rhodospirillaceae bacterium]|nr:Crp/Fnr family transcriptional regulator [Rhodospirillales bacterium]